MSDKMWDGLRIRPSMTSSYDDCCLRSLCRSYPDLLESFGYRLNSVTPSLAAAIGTGTHAGAKTMLVRKLGTGETGPQGEAEEAAVAALREEAEAGYQPDDLSPNLNEAEQQVLRMVNTYRHHVAPRINPLAVETRVEADAGDGFHISGQADVVAMEPGGIDDLKTGAVERSAMAQLGNYSLIFQPHGYKVDWLRQTFIPRVRLSKAQPEPVEVYYDVSMAERVAMSKIVRIKRDIIALCETGDTLVVPANPSSALCSARWCPAFGTTACRQHRGAK